MVVVLFSAALLLGEARPSPGKVPGSLFTTELVGMIHSVQLAESVQPLVDELIADDSLISLLADNSAAVRSFEGCTSWFGATDIYA